MLIPTEKSDNFMVTMAISPDGALWTKQIHIKKGRTERPEMCVLCQCINCIHLIRLFLYIFSIFIHLSENIRQP